MKRQTGLRWLLLAATVLGLIAALMLATDPASRLIVIPEQGLPIPPRLP